MSDFGILPSFSVAELAGQPVPTIPWFIKDVIPGEQTTAVYGDGAIGKSTLMIQLAVATVRGGSWLGFAPEKGPVVLVTCEDK